MPSIRHSRAFSSAGYCIIHPFPNARRFFGSLFGMAASPFHGLAICELPIPSPPVTGAVLRRLSCIGGGDLRRLLNTCSVLRNNLRKVRASSVSDTPASLETFLPPSLRRRVRFGLGRQHRPPPDSRGLYRVVNPRFVPKLPFLSCLDDSLSALGARILISVRAPLVTTVRPSCGWIFSFWFFIL